MNTNLVLRSTEAFGDTQTDIYENEDREFFMNSRQLGECLGYAAPIKGINTLIVRYPYLKTNEFSMNIKLKSVDGKMRINRVFNEDGIYEVAFLANTDKAFEFRRWVRQLLKVLRKGDFQLAQNNVTYSPALFEAQLTEKLGLLYNNLKPTPPNFWLWKKHTANMLINALADILQADTRTVYDLVYDRMTEDYGFDRSFAISQYCTKYGTENIAVIDAIADNATYASWFVSTAKRIMKEHEVR